jgi:hypothetical protein
MTGDTIVRYFDDEDEACEFINWVLSQDSTKLANIKKYT